MRNIIIKSLYVIACCMPAALFANPAYVTQDFNVFSNTIQAELSKNRNASVASSDPILIRDLVFKQFCATMQNIGETKTTPAYKNTADSIYYNPKHSAFVHVVCDWWLGNYKDSFKTRSTQDEKTYFLKDSWTSLGVYWQSEWDNQCNPSFGMNDCDVSGVFTSIMQRILNDMFDIKQAAVYGWIYIKDGTIEEKINNLWQQMFVGIQLCPNNKCDYPKTENRLKAYFKRGNSLLQRLDIIHWDYIKDIVSEKKMEDEDIDCSYPRKQDAQYHIFICGFGSQDRNSLDTFALMVNNELFFYRLFMAQYMWWIQSEKRILPAWYTSLERYAGKTADIIATTQQQIARTQDAVDLSTKMLREMYATFPIHIWLLIYYEDIYRLRKELAKVVTPLYTLYDKLRNVQKKDD